MKLKGKWLHVLLNMVIVYGTLFYYFKHQEKLNQSNFVFAFVILYFVFLQVSGAIKAIREYWVIKNGNDFEGRIEDFVYGVRLLGIAGYYPILSYKDETGAPQRVKYRSYRAMKKEHFDKVTIYRWRNFVVPLEFSEWRIM